MNNTRIGDRKRGITSEIRGRHYTRACLVARGNPSPPKKPLGTPEFCLRLSWSSLTKNLHQKGGWYGWKPSSRFNLSIRAFRAHPLIEIRQTILYRAIRANGISTNSIIPPLLIQKCPPPREDAPRSSTAPLDIRQRGVQSEGAAVDGGSITS